jgi:AcrR family transcriptional regulator
MKTKDKIVQISIDMFNKSGVVAVTTNHIAKELNMSPGNLYFHFRNKEEIIRQIFKIMCQETYQIWRVKKGEQLLQPLELIEKNYELFWKYRFFHREMYYLRRRDPQLGKQWKNHLIKVQKLMILMYKRWIQQGWMAPIQTQGETEFIVNILLATASTFLQFFESADKIPARKHIEVGKRYVAWLLKPWTEGPTREQFESFIFSRN